ncbi:hypothetical protein [Pseudomonas nitroreducens]|uniref:hypothetical protein n=1 Tax=Pseudomonas nitroreducens TaxID=46680 RepID=UPI002D80F003|nr:hypothetical protein [Pseudomonas nitroreducens]
MNREDVAMDVTVQNVEILRKEVQAAKLLLSECDEIFIEEGISNIELRGYLSGKLSADEVIELLDPPAEQRNQCDGCQAGIPLIDGAHRMGRPGGYPDLMSCQKERYKHPEQAEDDIKKLIVLLRHGDAMPGEQDLAADHLERLLKAEQAEGAQGEREAFEEWCDGKCFGSFSTRELLWPCWQARAALAQPSPAPELERPEVAVKVLISPDMKHIFVPSLPSDQQPRVADFIAHWMVNWIELAPAPAEFQRQIDELSKRHAETLGNLNRMREERAESVGDNLANALEAAQARVAELEKQEPVSTVSADYDKPVSDIIDTYLPPGTKLYAAPVAQAGQVPDECPHLILFDDADVEPIMFAGSGARRAALAKWEQVSINWNAHLFVRIEKNCRDDPYPCATLAAAMAQGGE